MLNKVTVIIPCHNVEGYIQECLDSVLLQGEAVHHTFVVDNNSTDGTVSKVYDWHQAHPTFPLTISEEKKPGAPSARNNPLSQVETKWIQFLDADDLLVERKISDQIEKFPECDVICAASKHLAIDGTIRNSLPEPNIPLALMRGQAGITSSNLFSTSSILAIQGWDESLSSSQEYNLMFRLWTSGAKFEVDDDVRAVIRERPSGQISQKNAAQRWRTILGLRSEMYLRFWQSSSLTESELVECLNVIFLQTRVLARYDLTQATKFHDEFFSQLNFQPNAKTVNSKIYSNIYKLIGFKKTESLLGKLNWRALNPKVL